MAFTSSWSRPKSAERIEGAMRTRFVMRGEQLSTAQLAPTCCLLVGARGRNITGVDHDKDEKTSPSMSPLKQALRRVDKLQAILEVAKAMAAAHSLDELLPLILKE